MTREKFITKYLGNPAFQYNEQGRDAMRDDLDLVINKKELLCLFFKFFRDNGEANIGMTIEQFVDAFLIVYYG